jgi:hypothetical protein
LERIEELEEKEVEVDLTDYIKKTDYATTDKSGVVKVKSTYGTGVIESNGQLFVVAAEEGAIDAKSSRYKPITPAYLDYAVKSVGDGYYATEAQLAEVDGVKEVYVGGETPPEGVGLIWIDSSKTAPDYATKEYVDNVVAASGSNVDLSDYYTKEEVDNTLKNYVEDVDLVDAVVAYAEEANYATSANNAVLAEMADYANNAFTADSASYAYKADVDGKGNDITTTYATKAELAAIGGGSGGGSKTYTFDFNIMNLVTTITDRDRAKMEELKATGAKTDYNLYVTDGTWTTKITKICFSNAYISLYLSEPYASIEYIKFYFKSDGTYKDFDYGWVSGDTTIKDWKWQDYHENNGFYASSYSHIKIVGYWDNNSNNITTYTLSTSNNNTFDQEHWSKYWVSKQYGSNAENLYFENSGGYLYFYDSHQSDLINNGSFTPLGMYYWG